MPYYLGATELTLILPRNVTITGSSVPLTLDEVASIIFEFEAAVDGYAAGRGYDVPIPAGATYAFAAIQKAVKEGAAARVLGILFPSMGGPGAGTSLASDYQKAYDTFIAGLRKGELALVDAGSSSGEGGRSLPVAGGVASPLVSLDWEP